MKSFRITVATLFRTKANLVPRSHSVLHLAVGDLGTRLLFPLTKGSLFERGRGLNRGFTVRSVIESCRNTKQAAASASYLTRTIVNLSDGSSCLPGKELKMVYCDDFCCVSSQCKVNCTVLVHRWKRKVQKNH